MAVERTFSIIKPDATHRNLTGKINAVIEAAGLRIVASSRFSASAGAADPAARRSTGALLPEVMGFWTPYFTAAHAIASIQQALRGP